MTTGHDGLRERKKQATREALRGAALRLALEHGSGNVRVEDIAAAAGVSPRTYNNYFSSREQAIVAAVTAERETSVAAAVAAQPAGVRLAEAVIESIVDRYTDAGEPTRDGVLLITTHPGLRETFLAGTSVIEHPLAEVIAARLGASGGPTARVLAASVAAALRVGLERWLQPPAVPSAGTGLVTPAGPLADVLRTALAPLEPAFDAAERSHPVSESAPAAANSRP
ncbi:TetR/AcrR family transcriptional regulator [Nocardia flavorosea]|uniref:TetR/AcrR family transcriptional regulator n=1 Tax=Nocardia flavorosea TaxID=53429 RepID=A0A846YC48_9NOCA|nr:TetR/AcrR family transcriptional regulator [Nocardia flavorosea]NKY55340.1 TetR/AcrR family transcriptional regulator [Nocardia flavorosea]